MVKVSFDNGITYKDVEDMTEKDYEWIESTSGWIYTLLNMDEDKRALADFLNSNIDRVEFLKCYLALADENLIAR